MGHLFLAVTLEGFKKHLQAKNSRITEKYLTAYQNAWAEIDPDCTNFIHLQEVGELVN
jgi:hypothetical protein